jgi:hypothetical protein
MKRVKVRMWIDGTRRRRRRPEQRSLHRFLQSIDDSPDAYISARLHSLTSPEGLRDGLFWSWDHSKLVLVSCQSVSQSNC